MNWKLGFGVLAVLLFASASADEGSPCVIPKGPPCITPRQLRALEAEKGHCEFAEEACITLNWDEYTRVLILKAKLVVTPACNDAARATLLEQQATQKLDTLQTVPIELTREERPCAAVAKVDIVITETGA